MLQRVSQACRSILRPGDLRARIGGIEFVVMLPEIDAAHAVALAETMNCVVQTTPATLGSLVHLRPPITLGMATSSRSNVEISAMTATAYGALLAAKQAGRNRMQVVRD